MPGKNVRGTTKDRSLTDTGAGSRDCIDLQLYVTDETPVCLRAYENLKAICRDNIRGRYRITVFDIKKDPLIARREDITAIPTLIRVPRVPGTWKIIGALTDTQKVLAGIGLQGQKLLPVLQAAGIPVTRQVRR